VRTSVPIILFVAWLATPLAQSAPSPSGSEIALLHKMLRDGHDVVHNLYYDQKFHGLDWDARFREYDRRIDGVASLNAGLLLVDEFLSGLDDSHTGLWTLRRSFDVDYGYRTMAIGDDVFITRISPGGDADGRLNRGERVIAIDGQMMNRLERDKFSRTLSLQPRRATTVRVRASDGLEREVTVQAKVTEKPKSAMNKLELPSYSEALDPAVAAKWQAFAERDGVLLWKLGAFTMRPVDLADGMERTAGHRALVLDLRGNGGGYDVTLNELVAHLYGRSVTIGRDVGRSGGRSVKLAKSGRQFTGQLVVVVDSRSGSNAEVFARAVQLEHRGTVVGDRTAGAVMQARIVGFSFTDGKNVVPYFFSVTIADFVANDGHTLEHVGVTPDEIVLPGPDELRSGADPALARAFALCGVTLTPADAAALVHADWIR